jgi:DNA-directed RNA polymerase specialized sigma24 family protein
MDAASLFRANLALIDRVVGEVCRGARLREADAEDFASTFRLALMENDYAILRQWEGRASLAGYLAIVARRLLCDQRVRELGRWRPSTTARRMGDAAVLLERLLDRDGRTIEEAIPLVRGVDPSLSPDDVVAMAARFEPHERRLRRVELEESAEPVAAARADDAARVWDAQRIARHAAGVVREAIAHWPDEDVVILRFRFAASMSIADIARMLRLPQRPLYRRLESMLASLRASLASAGVDATLVSEAVENASEDLDFGLGDGKSGFVEPSCHQEPSSGAEATQ